MSPPQILENPPQVEDRRPAEQWLAAQKRALEVAAGPASLTEALATLAGIVEEHSSGDAVAAILLLHEDGTLHTGGAPSLPAEYSAAIDGIKAAEGRGTCADAAALNRVVITTDIEAAPSWKGIAHLPLALGLKAAWSMPIVGASGKVLGTFGTYFRTRRMPSDREREVVEGLCQTAALAIERRRADEALRASEQRLRVALDAAELGTWTYEFGTNRWELDERGQELYGTGAPVVVHDEAMVRSILHHDDLPAMWEQVRQASDPAGPGRYECEYRRVLPDGSTRWLKAWARVVFEGQGEDRRAIRMIGSTRDITASKEAEDSLRQAKDEAERASAAKSEFLATLSHELRTPLTPVLLTVSLMESHPQLPEDLRSDLADIRRSVELESRLISDLLDLTRIERGKLDLDMQEVDLHLVLRSAIDICQRESSARLKVDLSARRRHVHGDPTRLQQIFWNLINNAMKFTPEGRHIFISSSSTPDGIQVVVRDEGVGIDAAVLPRLFTAFEQGEGRISRSQAGLGLGLAISRRLAEMHGGTIIASSDGRGHGATFIVALPLADVCVAQPGLPSVLPSRAGSIKPLHVLLVEDHEPTLKVLTRLLSGMGHSVTGAGSVSGAAMKAEQNGVFDVLICDLGLPDGSGYDVLERLRGRFEGRAIALTGYGMESDIAASRAAGFAEHLTKPVDIQAVGEAIARVVAGAEASA